MGRKKSTEAAFYRVELTRSFPRRGFIYKPGPKHRVDSALMEEMNAEDGLVATAVPIEG